MCHPGRAATQVLPRLSEPAGLGVAKVAGAELDALNPVEVFGSARVVLGHSLSVLVVDYCSDLKRGDYCAVKTLWV